MKNIIKKGLSKMLGPIIKKLGYVRESNSEIDDKNSLLNNFYTTLIQMGFSPGHIVDVGANHGTWTRETLKCFPGAYYTLLEPQANLKSSLQDILDSYPKVKFNAVGAGEKAGSFKFTIVNRDDSCSFRYTEEEARAKGYEQVEVPVVTLNDFLRDTGLPAPDLIKIDAEGLDIEVLKGASDFFGKTEVFMVEAGVGNKNFKNSFLNIINFMDEHGYRLFEITDLNRPYNPRILWLVELAFVRKNGYLDSRSII